MKPKFVIHTRFGNIFDPKTGIINNIDINDIAHSLANMSRYAGHSRRFYSVAEHSVLTYNIAKKLWPQDLDIQWAALLHDATEAYVTDLPTPIKVLLPNFNKLEHKIELQIIEKFNICMDNRVKKAVKQIDVEALSTEAFMLFNDVSNWESIIGVKRHSELLNNRFPIPSGQSSELFLKAFSELNSRRLSEK